MAVMTGDVILRRDGFLVGRLRVRGAGPDALAARQRAERAAGAALAPPGGLGPSAVLCVRKLRVAPAGAAPRRSEGVRAFLDRLLREAARPALGPVAAAAPAVLFADTAELLACLAGDWCAHTLAARWWWQALLRRAEGVQALLRGWLGAPEYIPAALGHLARRGELVPFARALPAAAARPLLQAVARVFALGEIGASFDTLLDAAATAPGDAHPSLPAPPRGARRAGDPAAETAAPHADAPARRELPDPPWARGVPEAQEAGLLLPVRCLVGLGLMLHRAPAEVRARPFAEALRRWLPDGAAPRPAAPATAESVSAEGSPSAPRPADRAGPPAQAGGVVAAGAPLTPPSRTPPSAGTRPEAPPLPDMRGPSEVPPSAPAPCRPAAAVTPSDPAPPGAEALETKQGGIFYLINLALFLELYGDFTSPTRAALPLPLWDFLALLGERLTGAGLRLDPVWELLARLAGRGPDEPPGRDFAAPEEWRLPADWLAALPDHTAREDDASRPPLDRWLGWLMPYVRARLCRALGLADADGLAELLLAHRARVTVTATHLDVVFSLAELPLAIRLAGLDRDPGWVPAAGRFIAFHFE